MTVLVIGGIEHCLRISKHWALSEDIKTLNWKEVGTLAISETEKKKSYRFLEF